MYFLATVCSVLLLIADQLTKYLVVKNFELYESKAFIPKLLNLTYIQNTGGAWGLLSGKTWFLVIFTVVAISFCVYILIKKGKGKPLLFWAMCLVLSGGIGNMIDRIFKGGKVVDFIQTLFIDFPIFNVADCAIVIGAGLLILYLLLDIIREKREKSNE